MTEPVVEVPSYTGKKRLERKVSLKKPKKRVVKTDKQKKFAARKRKLEKERELWASFGFVRPVKPRYVGIQGILWFVCSKAVRMEEFAKYGGYCGDGCGGKVENWQDAHCGHFESAGRAQTRFVRENLILQLPKCNTDQNNGRAIQYRIGKTINERYGEGTAEQVSELANTTGSLSEEYILEKIAYYKAILETVNNPQKED